LGAGRIDDGGARMFAGKTSLAVAIEGTYGRFLLPGGRASLGGASCRLGGARGGQEKQGGAPAMARVSASSWKR
jgi:hypothetical protein